MELENNFHFYNNTKCNLTLQTNCVCPKIHQLIMHKEAVHLFLKNYAFVGVIIINYCSCDIIYKNCTS